MAAADSFRPGSGEQKSARSLIAFIGMSEPGFAAEPVLFNVDTGAVKDRRVMGG